MESLDLRLPQARDQAFTMQQLDEELLVYDPDHHRCHSLNRTAALVWRHCDGQTRMSEMAVLLQQELNLPPDAGIVQLALDHLESAHLLQQPVVWPADTIRCSRREMVRKLGLVGALTALLPVVDSIVAPTPAAAASGDQDGDGKGKGKGKDKDKEGKHEATKHANKGKHGR
jgi:hypothetical protein